MTHSDLVKAVMLEIQERDRDALCWNNNTGALKDATGRLVRYGLPGSSDVIACVKGRFVGVECKVGHDTQRDNQKRFSERAHRAGGIYILARSIDDVVNRLRMEGLVQ